MADGQLSPGEPSDESVPRRQLLEPGTMVDGFKVMRLVGEGGVGEVYLARDTRLGRKVALKLLLAHAGGPAAAARFQREAQATARFSHQHIVAVHAVGEHQGRPYIALEYIEGETLRARLEGERPSLKGSLRIALAIAEALCEAHRHGVLHRDLKPENVLLGKDGRPRVVDFGLAQLGDGDGDADAAITAGEAPVDRVPGALMGTPAYMAPEQWLAGPCTPATDVWALGLILHELVHGKLPLATRSLRKLARLVTAPDPLPETAPPAGVPEELVLLIRRCLAKRAAERPQTQEVRDKLEALIGAPRVQAGDEAVMPFRGLFAFTEQHADFFFGRSGEVLEVLERLREQAVLPIVGMSGAGKSSFIQAGVLPRLREQGAWTVIPLRPGARPLANLARGLTAAAGAAAAVKTLASGPHVDAPVPADPETVLAEKLRQRPAALAQVLRAVADETRTRVLLLIDQIEEIHTHVTDPEERRAFLVAVCTAADDRQDPVRVCFTVRDDFLGRLAEDCDSPEVRAVLGRVFVLRTPGPQALAEILTRPVELIGYRYESAAIVDDMVAVIRGAEAGLPLLQFAARMLWERRDRERRLLLVGEYHALGGVAGALAEHAESTLAGMTAAEIAVARALLLRLVTPERTRHVVRKDRLLEGLPPAAEVVADRLIDSRLLAVRKGHDGGGAGAEIELAHESLVHRWGRFGNWIDESKEELVFLAELEQAARLWERRGRSTEEAWQGDALAAARQRVERLAQGHSALAGEFLAAGARFERSRRRRRRVLWGAALAFLLVALGASIATALVIADKERVAGRRLAESLRESARAALARDEVFQARATLRSALESEDSLVARALWRRLKEEPLWARHRSGSVVFAVALADGGRTAVVSDLAGKLRFIDVATLQQVTLRGLFEPILSLVPLAGDRRVLIGTFSGKVGVADRASAAIRYFDPTQDGPVTAVASTRDGARGFSLGSGGLVRQWDLATGTLIGERQRPELGNWMVMSPDDRLLALGGGGGVRIEDRASGELRQTLPATGGTYQGVFSPDGTMLAVGTDAPAVELYAVASGERLHTFPGPVRGLAFSHHAGWLALGGEGGIRLIDVATHQVRAVVRGSTEIAVLVVSADDRRIVSIDGAEGLAVWDVERARPRVEAPAHDGALAFSAMSPDGRLIVSIGTDGSLLLWSGDDGRPFAKLASTDRGVWDLAVHPDHIHVYTAGTSGIRIWNAVERRAERILSGELGRLSALVLSQDGRWLAAVDERRTVRVWHAPRGELATVMRWEGPQARSLALSPDGRWLASGHDDGTVRVWDVPTGRLLRELPGHRAMVSRMSFSPDGETLVSLTYGADLDVRRWRWRQGTSEVIFERREVLPRLFHRPDGSIVLSDKTLELFDPAGHHQATCPLYVEKAEGVTSDGKWIMIDAGLISLETLMPKWRGIGMLAASREVLTDAGWFALDPAFPGAQPSPARWRTDAAGAMNVVESTDGQVICVRRSGRELAGWSRATDQPLFRRELAGDEDYFWTVALPGGCAIMVEREGREGEVRLYGPGESSRVVIDGVRALGRDGGGLVVATPTEIVRFDPDLRVAARYPGLADVSVVARLDDTAVLIGAQGNAAGVARQGEPARLYFEDVPGEVTQIAVGPEGTAVAGTGNGHVGIWNVATGRRLDLAKLGHVIERIEVVDKVVYALSGHGERLAIDLSVYAQPYCDLLRDVWERVPVVWENGEARPARVPGGHGCAPPR